MMPLLAELSGPQQESAPEDTRTSHGNRQLAAVLFMAILLVSLIASLSYLVGRLSGAPEAVRAQSEIRKRAQEQVIVVDPVVESRPAKPSPSAPEAGSTQDVVKPPLRLPSRLRRSPSSFASTARPAKTQQTQSPPELHGQTFLQVAAVERGMADASVEFLQKKGIPARLGDVASPGVHRVLVGPLNTSNDIDRTKASLESAGFHPFLRKY